MMSKDIIKGIAFILTVFMLLALPIVPAVPQIHTDSEVYAKDDGDLGDPGFGILAVTPSVMQLPTASLTVGQTLSNVPLTGGTVSAAGVGVINGKFEWVNPTQKVTTTQSTAYQVKFVATPSGLYNDVTMNVTLTAGKATPTVLTLPHPIGSIVVGQSLNSVSLLGGSINVPGIGVVAGSFQWVSPNTIITNVGATKYQIRYVPTDTTNYNSSVITQVSVTAGKAAPVIKSFPQASNIVVGQTLSQSTLSGGTVSVAGIGVISGHFEWANPSTQITTTGTTTQNIIFVPSNTNLYNTAVGTASLTTGKATPSISALPSVGNIVVGQTLSQSTLSGGSASVSGMGTVSGTFEWSSPTTRVTTTGIMSYSVTFKPSNTTLYNNATTTVTLTAGKATPSVGTLPSVGNIVVGQTLSQSTLSGGSASVSGMGTVSGTFEWSSPTTRVTTTKAMSYNVTFKPSNTTLYNDATTTVTLTAGKATPVISGLPNAGSIVVGQTLLWSTLSGGTANVAGMGEIIGHFEWVSPETIITNVTATKHQILFVPADPGLYNSSSVTQVSLSAGKATPNVSVLPQTSEIILGQTLSGSELTGGTVSVAGIGEIDGTFRWVSPGTVTTKAGVVHYEAEFTPNNETDFNRTRVNIPVTVNRKTISINDVHVPYTLLYKGTSNEEVEIEISAEDFTEICSKPYSGINVMTGSIEDADINKAEVQFGDLSKIDKTAVKDMYVYLPDGTMVKFGKQTILDSIAKDEDPVFTVEKGSVSFDISDSQKSIAPYTYSSPYYFELPLGASSGNTDNIVAVDEDNNIIPRSMYVDGSLMAFTYSSGTYNTAVVESLTFSDVTAAWMKPAINFMSARKVVEGVGAGSFAPGNNITRQDFAVMLMRTMNLDLSELGSSSYKFKDDDDIRGYAKDYVYSAYKLGIISGTGDDNFSPTKMITRQEAFTMIHRAMGVFDMLPSYIPEFELTASDKNKISNFAVEPLTDLWNLGIIKGSQGRILPRDNITRAETAQILYNIISFDFEY